MDRDQTTNCAVYLGGLGDGGALEGDGLGGGVGRGGPAPTYAALHRGLLRPGVGAPAGVQRGDGHALLPVGQPPPAVREAEGVAIRAAAPARVLLHPTQSPSQHMLRPIASPLTRVPPNRIPRRRLSGFDSCLQRPLADTNQTQTHPRVGARGELSCRVHIGDETERSQVWDRTRKRKSGRWSLVPLFLCSAPMAPPHLSSSV
eukprot:1179795-Prorocentrum_minimum.AAC.7